MAQLDYSEVPYTQVTNLVLQDKTLSWKARGIYAYLFSKPPGWDFSTHRIQQDATDGRESLLAGIKELEAAGYLQRKRQADGRMKYILIHEKPQTGFPTKAPIEPQTGFPTEGKPHSGKTRPVTNKEGGSNKDIDSNKDIAVAAAPGLQEPAEPETIDEHSPIEKQIGEIIFLFKDVNPSYKILYQRNPQREAARRLIEMQGFTTTANTVRFLQRSNRATHAPTITTPCQLEENLGKLIAWGQKQKALLESKKTVIV